MFVLQSLVMLLNISSLFYEMYFITKRKLDRYRETEAKPGVIPNINVSPEISPHFQEKVENVCGVTVR